MANLTLKELLSRHAVEGALCAPMDRQWVQCTACGHRCKIPPGRDGICKVRYNEGGTLMVPHGYVAGLAVDPIEKKPFFHVLPGSNALSFGMLGCDYHCAYCQNWITSQAIRDPAAGSRPSIVTAEHLVGIALEQKIPVLTSTYNEPLITSEWAVEVFTLARTYGIRCSYVSNGNGTPEVLAYLRPFIDFYKVDLKGFNPKHYRELGGRIDAVLETIRALKEMQVWIEIVTLLVPGFNDSPEELREITRFLVSVSHDIPWHVTAFHQDYRMTEPHPTQARELLRAAEIGREAGLRFVYAGNLPGQMGRYENTYCPTCDELLVERVGFTVKRNLLREGRCRKCATVIPGVWS
jgi:pyruvate formate lyase activating enzyme